MSAKVMGSTPREHVTPREMRCGQIGTFRYDGQQILALRTFSEIVDLNDAASTWGLDASYDIELLPAGTKIEVEAE
jgi:hypothetical protein